MLCRLAGCPTRTSPSSVKATIDGVVRAPSAFSMTLALFPSITATQELVVPRSIPIAFAMIRLLVSRGVRVASFVEAAHRQKLCGVSDYLRRYAGRAKRVVRNGKRVPHPLVGSSGFL